MAMTDSLAPPRTKGPIVWLDMDQTELDNAYDQAVYAPNQPLVHARRNAANARAKARLGAPHGSSMAPARSRASTSTAPENPENAPINIYVHGGAWRNGRSADFAFLSEMIVDAGAHSVIVDFNSIDDVGGNLMTMARRSVPRSPGSTTTRRNSAATRTGSISPDIRRAGICRAPSSPATGNGISACRRTS